MKLHEPIDVGRKSINAILHARESLIHFFPENAKVKIDDIESPINLHKPAINLLKSPVNLLESPIIPRKPTINLFDPPIILRESTIDLFDSPIIPRKPTINLFDSPIILRDPPIIPRKRAIDPTKSRIRPLKSSPKKPFNNCKALIDGSSLLCRFLLSHLSYLAALSPDESQDLKFT